MSFSGWEGLGMYSIRKLAEKYHLSRTALLYYESIGLLTASGKTAAGYRIYSEQDAQKLAQIGPVKMCSILHSVSLARARHRRPEPG